MATESNLPDDPETLKGMIADLRKENADRRVRTKAYEEAFGEFNDKEKQYLLDLVATTASDPQKGARAFRDLARNMIGDDQAFLEGLDIEMPAQEEKKEALPVENDEEMTLTEEQMQKLLDERDAKRAETESKKAEEAAIEEVYKEIEALGFERGSEGFTGVLSLASAKIAAGAESVDFAELAPKVAAAFDIPWGATDDSKTEAEAETEDAPTEVSEDASAETVHPVTAEAGSAAKGGPGESAKDWVAEAKSEGRDVFEVSRERAAARLATSE